MTLRNCLLLGCAAAALCAPAAHAESTAAASLTGISYELIDLNPNDGIAASLSLTDQSTFLASAGFMDNSGLPNPLDFKFAQGATAVATGAGNAGSSFDGIAAQAHANVTGKSFLSGAIVGWNFVLSANTTVVFKGLASASVASTGNTTAYGDAGIFARYATPSAPQASYVTDHVLLNSGTEGRTVTFSLSSSNESMSGLVGMEAWTAGAEVPAAPVPEPGTYAMLLGGLALLAYRARRRQG